ncbi:hypothetical protein INR49_003016 [Caranx melampygus]|nr:hypothetical protein INR49_003016 [Caranx melampygus]
MSIMAHGEDHYYEKITSIQQTMHKREKRRLELERELFAYTRSDKRISQIKYSKLRSYLKEISDREARAKMRNLELLRDVECIEISMKEYRPDHGPLQQQKMKGVHRMRWDSSLSHAPKNFTQSPAVIFMDCQTSRGSDVEAGTTSVHSHQALHRSPNRSMQSHERLPSGLLKDFRVGGEDATSNRAHLSDDISGSNDSPDGCNLSDKHERMMAVLPSVCALTATTGSVPFGSDDEQEPSPLVTLTAPEKNPSPSSRGPMRAKNSPAEHSNSQEVAHQPLIMEAGQRGRCESVSTPSSDVQLSESSVSDLSISLTQSELEEDDLPEGVQPERNASLEGVKITNSAVKIHLSTLEGLFNLLDSIEGRLHDERTNRLSWSTAKGCLLPQDLVSSHQSSPEPNEISTSLPPDAARLWDRWFKHALLLKERRVLNTERLVQLFTPLLLERHATYSHQAKVLLRTLLSRSSEECPSAEDKSDLSSSCGPSSLLVDDDVKPARPVQKQWIQELQSTEEDSQDESPVESVPIRETKAYQLLKQSAMQERLQSSEEEKEEEEDGLSGINHGNEEDLGRAKRSSHQDPYPRKNIVIIQRATGNGPPDTKVVDEREDSLKGSFCPFWGESDDSNAEIEAALRPQPFNANNDDTDGFYD